MYPCEAILIASGSSLLSDTKKYITAQAYNKLNVIPFITISAAKELPYLYIPLHSITATPFTQVRKQHSCDKVHAASSIYIVIRQVSISGRLKIGSRVSLLLPEFSPSHLNQVLSRGCLLSILQHVQFVRFCQSLQVNLELQHFLLALTFYQFPPSNPQGYT